MAKQKQDDQLKLTYSSYVIPPPAPVLDYGTKYNPSGSQPGLNDTNYGTPFATTLSASLQSLCYNVEKQIESSLQESDHTLPCPTL